MLERNTRLSSSKYIFYFMIVTRYKKLECYCHEVWKSIIERNQKRKERKGWRLTLEEKKNEVSPNLCKVLWGRYAHYVGSIVNSVSNARCNNHMGPMWARTYRSEQDRAALVVSIDT
jgi:hypothetical protein